jgi:hypothetical protein
VKENQMEETSRRHPLLIPGIVVGLILLAVVLYWFAPQTLLFGREVNEALPEAPIAADAADTDTGTDAATDAGQSAGSDDAAAAEPGAADTAAPAELARGSFSPIGRYSGEGTALLLDVGGTPFVRFEDFETTNGPDLRVYLSAAPADADPSLHDDDFADLGPLTANRGDQNYEVPADVDPSRYRSVVVWCRRFSVGFAVAPLG